MALSSTHRHFHFHHFPTRTSRFKPSISAPNPLQLPHRTSGAHQWHRPLVPGAQPPLHPVALPEPGTEEEEVEQLGSTSAAAVAFAIRRASNASPVRFRRRRAEEVRREGGGGAVAAPSADFRLLCAEQLEMFRKVICRNAVLSVYVRPAGSYVMDQLELRKVALHPGIDGPESEGVLLVGNFAISAGLRAAEASLVKQQMEVVPEFAAVVLPLVKHPFVVGFLVAELPEINVGPSMSSHDTEAELPSSPCMDGSSDVTWQSKGKTWDFQTSGDLVQNKCQLSIEWRSRALTISQTLAMAHVMDQKALLLQQTSWQNNVRMCGLVEQIRAPLSSIRALAKMLSAHTKRSEIPYDIIQDILIQGDHMKDALQQMQDVVYLTKANIVRYNEETLKKPRGLPYGESNSLKNLLDNGSEEARDSPQRIDPVVSMGSEKKDIEMPMPPLWLAPLQHHDARQCNICEVLKDLVGAALPLACKQQRTLEFTGISHPLQVTVEESALRQALSNLIEGALLRSQLGGRVQIHAGGAPSGGILVIIDDDGPDMQYMTQMHSLAPFGLDLLSEGMLEDNMTWNFVAGLTVAREILENYGCVIRVISPRKPDAVIGTGGSRIELWLPTLQTELAEIHEET